MSETWDEEGDREDDVRRRRPGQFGRAGSGLGQGSATSQFGHHAKIGADGERHFQKALIGSKVNQDYNIWWSLSIPQDPSGGRRYRGDVDVAIANGNKLVLVDVKKWAAGKVYWSLFGISSLSFKGFERIGGGSDGGLSKNMSLAVDRYSKNLPGIQVSAMVVFVPTTKRGTVPTLLGLRWPGGIKSYLYNDGARAIRKRLGEPVHEVDPSVAALLGRMLR